MIGILSYFRLKIHLLPLVDREARSRKTAVSSLPVSMDTTVKTSPVSPAERNGKREMEGVFYRCSKSNCDDKEGRRKRRRRRRGEWRRKPEGRNKRPKGEAWIRLMPETFSVFEFEN